MALALISALKSGTRPRGHGKAAVLRLAASPFHDHHCRRPGRSCLAGLIHGLLGSRYTSRSRGYMPWSRLSEDKW
jgi:hypothetical protein